MHKSQKVSYTSIHVLQCNSKKVEPPGSHVYLPEKRSNFTTFAFKEGKGKTDDTCLSSHPQMAEHCAFKGRARAKTALIGQ